MDGDPDMALEATRVKHTGPLTIHFTRLKQTPCFHFVSSILGDLITNGQVRNINVDSC